MLNYFADDRRQTPINLAVVRVLICTFLIYKLIRYEWGHITTWPTPIWPGFSGFLIPLTEPFLPELAMIAGFCLLLVLLGYRVRATAYISAILVTYLTTIRLIHQPSHTTDILYSGVFILLFYAVFAEQDKLTIDEWRQTRERGLEWLNQSLQSDDETYRHAPLKWSLVLIGVLYFQTGISKLIHGRPLEWVQSASLSRYILFNMANNDASMPIGELLLASPRLVVFLSVLTIAIEIGLLIAVLLKRSIIIAAISLLGMHLAIMFSVGPVFFDQMLFLLIFLAWDTGLKSWQPETPVKIVYDEHCLFCARSLYLFKLLDANDTLEFRSQYSVPSELRDIDGVKLEDSMYVLRGGMAYEGYYAFRELLRQVRVGSPIAWVMGFRPVAFVGERVYRYVADNRSRYFVCSVSSSSD